MPRVKMQVRSRPIVPKVDVSLEQAEQVLNENLGPKLTAWKPLNTPQATSEILTQLFGKGWSLPRIYERQKSWHKGQHYLKCGRTVTYNVPAIVQWVLEQQGAELN